jgi:hypothetical protein
MFAISTTILSVMLSTTVSKVLTDVLLKIQVFWIVKDTDPAIYEGLYCPHVLGQTFQEVWFLPLSCLLSSILFRNVFPPQKFVYTPEFTWIVLNKELHIYICIQRPSIRIRFNEIQWFLSLNRPTVLTYALFPHTLPRCKLDRLVLPDVLEWRPARIWQKNRSSSQKTFLVLLSLFWTKFGTVTTLIYVTQSEKQYI